MAGKNVIKGLTVEIGGDTTKLGKALQNVEDKSRDLSSELGQVNKLLKMDPGNTELLAQKQKILADAVENTSQKLETLREASEHAAKTAGNYDAWRAKYEPLQDEIGKAADKLKELKKQQASMEDAGDVGTDAYKQLQEEIAATGERLKTLRKQVQDVNKEFGNPASPEQVRALQREIVATEQKLQGYENAVRETAEEVQNLGEKSRAAKNASEGLGDTLDNIGNVGLAAVGGAVTAAITGLTAAAEATRDYRMEMGKLDTAFQDNGFSSQTATTAYKELVGVLGEYDQSVEAANHLAKLTDNEKDLAAWTGDILPGVFATFGDSLPIEGLTEAANHTAKLGEVQGPLADALEWMGVSTDSFNESLAKCNTEQERQALITSTLSGLYGEASAAYKETNADVIAANQANDAWTASLAGVGAAVEPLITKVKTIGAELLTKLVPVIEKLLDNLPTIGVALAGITAALVSYKVAALAATAAEKGMTVAQYAAAAAQKVLNAAMKANPIGLVIIAITALVSAFMYLWKNSESFRNFWINLWEKIKSTVSKTVDWLKNMPQKIYSALLGAVSKVQAWGSNMASKAREAMQRLITTAVSALKALPGKVLSIGGDLVSGLWNGITNKLSWLKSKISGFASSVLGSIKNFFGVHSPSTEMAWIGDMLDRGLAEGMLDNMNNPVKAMQRVAGGVLDAATGMNGLGVERGIQTRRNAATVAQASATSGLAGKLDLILAAIERGQVITIDGKALVGSTADSYDNALGQRRVLAARGAR